MDNLPLDMKQSNTCCFTGHRLIPMDKREGLQAQLCRVVRILAGSGFRYFLCGGALGFDTMAAQTVLSLSEELDIRLVLVLPCRNQTDKWASMKDGIEHIREYKRIAGLASAIHYIGDFYYDGCMRDRNQFMVDHSGLCVAYYDGSPRSGSGQTFRMAQKAGRKIYNLCTVM